METVLGTEWLQKVSNAGKFNSILFDICVAGIPTTSVALNITILVACTFSSSSYLITENVRIGLVLVYTFNAIQVTVCLLVPGHVLNIGVYFRSVLVYECFVHYIAEFGVIRSLWLKFCPKITIIIEC
ncbi:hypothetical protein AX774_g6080 [Zancudomyces culisetae]|uniref:Uncharacterized protein n=1 Tax=Zancudomyces culisetae TaxID=1213189 RepID=A0A1R1PHM0_ZANCU|nr:hypothetical protein AX774_g6080 [Zancudomyces culisetae]|eukprot:OMH80485.1 hypothetical protein AX774_g6080 [Zancudomyces culisetae]